MGRNQASDVATRMLLGGEATSRPIDAEFQQQSCRPGKPGIEVIPTQLPGDQFNGKDCSAYRSDNRLVEKFNQAKKGIIYIESYAYAPDEERKDKRTRLDILRGARAPEAGKEKLIPVTGSGFFITADGRALTSYHVVKDAPNKKVTVKTEDGKTYDAYVDALDPKRELALLRIARRENETFKPLTLRMTSDMNFGDRMLGLGYPQGNKRLHLSIGGQWVRPGPFDDYREFMRDKLFVGSDGSGFVPGGYRQKLTMADYVFDPTGRRTVRGGLLKDEDPNRKVIEADMKAEPGNSGGPVTDENFEVAGLLGMTSRKVSRIGATPVEDIWDFVNERRVFQTINPPSDPGRLQTGFDFLSRSMVPSQGLSTRVDGMLSPGLRSRLRERIGGK